uniref:Uncharacterized protein n=1 Tax=Amphimedon queenslandica TaxID=400682 RepID=A0A1X7TBL2_AMPQE
MNEVMYGNRPDPCFVEGGTGYVRLIRNESNQVEICTHYKYFYVKIFTH